MQRALPATRATQAQSDFSAEAAAYIEEATVPFVGANGSMLSGALGDAHHDSAHWHVLFGTGRLDLDRLPDIVGVSTVVLRAAAGRRGHRRHPGSRALLRQRPGPTASAAARRVSLISARNQESELINLTPDP
jgi:hypothetical protein